MALPLSQSVKCVFDCEEIEKDLETCMKCCKVIKIVYERQNMIRDLMVSGVLGMDLSFPTLSPSLLHVGLLLVYVNKYKSRIFSEGLQIFSPSAEIGFQTI